MSEAAAEAAEVAAPTLVQKLAAETIGTFVLVFLGCGTAVATGLKAGDASFNGTVGLAFGLAIVISVYAFGRISGGHFNPAVSVGAALSGRIAWAEAGLYSIAQILGGIIGALVLFIVFKGFSGFSSTRVGLGANGYGDHASGISWWAALIAEIVMTSIFVAIVLAVTDQRNKANAMLAPLAIGLSLAAIHFVGISLTGTSVNPARSIGPALFSGSAALKDLWLFIVAPLIGAVISGLLYPLIFGKDADPVPGSGLSFGSGGSSNPAFTQQWGQQPVAQQQPIIQDGWQWDPASQQWIPAQQQPTPQAPQAPQGGMEQQGGGWNPPEAGGEHTQVRPPQ
ncbi:MAG: MIP family channel protein [Nocardioidaceae bacterium]|nr:MIP family channel protein [Nocardioidaceae bacterium]MCL2612426.1 MIP family channel protein [Nocardioidaceae bacterium]